MCSAILSNGGVHGVRVTLVNTTVVPMQAPKLEGISALNNFLFTENGLTYWKAYQMGSGKMITWSNLQGGFHS